MKVEIDINDYLSETKIKEIISDEMRYCVRERLRTYTDIEIFMKNVGFHTFLEAGSKAMRLTEDELQGKIVQHLTELFNDDHTYRLQLFRRKNSYTCTEDGIDTKILDDVLSKSRPIIERKVNEFIEKYDFREVKEDICDTIYEVVTRKIFGSNSKE